jgi:DNA-binding CsgD family transcriptional regulator
MDVPGRLADTPARIPPGPDRDVLAAIARGANRAQIALRLGLTIEQVIAARRCIFRSYRVDSAAEAVAVGFACGDLRTTRRAARRPPRRRREVLVLVAQGFTSAQIGIALWISEDTVRTHMRILFEDFGVHSRPALVCEAVRGGVLVPGADRRRLVLAR